MPEKQYSKEVILKAGELGEINMIDVNHLCTLLDEAEEIINPKPLTPEELLILICKIQNITKFEIKSNSKKQWLFYSRVIFCQICKDQNPNLSSAKIAKYINRGRVTVGDYYKKMISYDKEIKKNYEIVKSQLKINQKHVVQHVIS